MQQGILLNLGQKFVTSLVVGLDDISLVEIPAYVINFKSVENFGEF